MAEQELRIIAEAKFEAVKSFIYKMADEYEKLQDEKKFYVLEPWQRNEIESKSDILNIIKYFLYNNS